MIHDFPRIEFPHFNPRKEKILADAMYIFPENFGYYIVKPHIKGYLCQIMLKFVHPVVNMRYFRYTCDSWDLFWFEWRIYCCQTLNPSHPWRMFSILRQYLLNDKNLCVNQVFWVKIHPQLFLIWEFHQFPFTHI